MIDSDQFEIVDEFVYFDSLITVYNDTSREIQRRIIGALVVFEVSLVHGLSERLSDNEYSNSTKVLTRRKRYLIFRDISRGFARCNVKDRAIDSTNIWAQGVGYRWNVEFNNPPGLRITKRDLHNSIDEMIQSHDFDGRACILRAFCEISKSMTPKSGILFKLFKKIFAHSSPIDESSTDSNSLPEGDELYFPFLKSTDCVELDQHCPISHLALPDGSEVR
ncbi:uncharacterized protein LOC128735554 [Sabethes cyaneus]|uniref:uncharacterized protein LOC128735554 n=1 Tax=Sabethes cyaneus TaxID=53552 RepID=UPI00237E6364|nr:uncharacterized protein LOC128735554 [Sabethes cyaneus]